jgi:hypothetical protein
VGQLEVAAHREKPTASSCLATSMLKQKQKAAKPVKKI